MKKGNIIFILMLLFGTVFISCGGSTSTNSTNDSTEQVVDKSGPEYTSAYICPMHCKGSGSAQAGKCPTCEMAYVQNKNSKNNQHNHDHHHGHDHDHSHDHHGHDHSH